ncbi:hypothetical protein [Devosia sp. Root685]|uniref:hypothetical protein n=1 Tax=Devosia sp. Root685 TaxID=1736587 RepID=UPI0006F41C93|nr:hypothetical protein [Devosia sp. Root685]
MRKLVMCLTLLFGTTLPAFAALPPQYQRSAEFAAVLNVATEVLGIGNLIDAIETSEPDIYSVRSGACTLIVRIVDTPKKQEPGWAGPRQFEAVADPLTC